MTSSLDKKLWSLSHMWHYGIAVALAVVALFGRSSLQPALGSTIPFGFSILPVAIAAYIGGFWPGMLSASIGLIASVFLFLNVDRTNGMAYTDGVALVMSLVISFFISAIAGRLRKSAKRNTLLVQQVEREANLVANVLNSISDAFYTLDRDWTVVQTNPAIDRITEKTVGVLLGKNIWEVYKGRENTPIHEALIKAMNDREKQVLEVNHPESGKWYRVQAFPTEFGVSVFNQDISEMKELELVREKTLANERAARSAAEEAGRAKDEFLAVLSHELRTPMTSLLGWAELLAPEAKGSEKLTEGLAMIEQSARKQLKMIEDLLDVGTINAGKLRLEMELLAFADIVEEAIYFHRPAAEAKNISLKFVNEATDVIVRGDSARIHQVFSNLVSNAIKFTPRYGQVHIRAYKDGSTACVDIEDTGEGIAPEVLPFIFDRFRQANSKTSRVHGGLGLGLSIAKQLISLHGGSLDAHSDGEGKGSHFNVCFPVASIKPLPAISDLPDNSGLDLDDVRILIVEDDASTRLMLKRLLEEQDMTVQVCEDAMTALDIIPNFKPCILLSDIGLPDVDGYGLIKKIRVRDDEYSTLPAIALTAFARDSDRQDALAAGFNAFHTKPVNVASLLTTICQLNKRVDCPRDPAE